jgi:serine O-acetyltransferase
MLPRRDAVVVDDLQPPRVSAERPALLAVLREDLASTVGEKLLPPARFWLRAVGKLMLNPRVQAVVRFRLGHALVQRRLTPLAMFLRARSLRHAGAEIHPGASIGPGLCLVHSSGIVIGGSVVIGRNCRLHQGVTLGSAGVGATGTWGEPVVGDDVTIGAHAVILGPLRIGDRAVIAANAVVTKDVADDSVVGGVPARVLRINEPVPRLARPK